MKSVMGKTIHKNTASKYRTRLLLSRKITEKKNRDSLKAPLAKMWAEFVTRGIPEINIQKSRGKRDICLALVLIRKRRLT